MMLPAGVPADLRSGMNQEPHKPRPLVYVSRRRRRKGDLVSAFIYAVAVVVTVALGAMFYGAYHKAKRDAARGYGQGELPGRVVGVTTAVVSEIDVPEPAPAPPPKTTAPTTPAGIRPIVVAVDRRTDAAPEIRPTPRVPWGVMREDVANPLRSKLLPVADTLVAAPPLQDRNGGSVAQLALKGADRVMLARFDLAAVQGWTVVRAVWHAKTMAGRLGSLSFSTVPVDWQEGGGDLSEASDGATYQGADGPDAPWTPERLPFPAVTRGRGGSRVCFAEPDNPENQTGDWVKYELKPEVVQALISGAAHGLAIMDEKGQLNLDAAIASREDQEYFHFLEVDGRAIDLAPPAQIEAFYAYTRPELRRARSCGALLTWLAPGDDEMQGQAFRYDIRYAMAESETAFDDATRVDATRLPLPLPAGHEEQFVLAGLDPDTAYTVFIRAADEAGQFGPVSRTSVTTAPPLALDEPFEARQFDGAPVDLALGLITLEVMDELQAAGPAGEATVSYLWDKASRSLHLAAARGDVATVVLKLGSKSKALPVVVVEPQPVLAPGGEVSGVRPALLQSTQGRLRPPATGTEAQAGEARVLVLEYPVPADAKPGLYRSKIRISVPDKPDANLNVFLDVSAATLDAPAFTVELAAEIQPAPDAAEKARTAIAAAHRCTFAAIPYSARGDAPAPLVPEVGGSGKDLSVVSWAAWDERYAELLSRAPGYALLPVFEGWPVPFVEGYTCADQDVIVERGRKAFAGTARAVGGCLTAEYGEALAAAAGAFGKHFKDIGRDAMDGHVWFLTEPTADYSGFAPPWNLGRPTTRDDVATLAVLAEGVMGGAHFWRGGRLIVRASLPDLRVLDDAGSGFFGLLAVGDTNLCLWPLVQERIALTGEQLWLQTDELDDLEGSALAGLVLGAFLAGADGWTVLAPDRSRHGTWIDEAGGEPAPTLKLALVRRLQADIDLLRQLQARRKWTREQLKDYVGQYMALQDCRPVVSPPALRLLRQATLDALARSMPAGG
jgi:hypothetical protein